MAAANEFGKKALWKLGEGYFVDVSAVTVAHALVYAGTLMALSAPSKGLESKLGYQGRSSPPWMNMMAIPITGTTAIAPPLGKAEVGSY